MKTKRKSTFVNFLLNSLSFFDATLAILRKYSERRKAVFRHKVSRGEKDF
jgi:hypothetical protein